MSEDAGNRFDIVIAGAGYSGLSLALAVSRVFNDDIRIGVVGRQPSQQDSAESARAFALSASSKNLLDVLGLWQGVAGNAQPVREIALTDSPLEAGVRPILLTYSNLLADGQPASHILPAEVLTNALQQRVEQSKAVTFIADDFEGFSTSDSHAAIALASGASVATTLLVATDGSHSRLRKLAGLQTVGWHHGQIGIVTWVDHEKPHNGRAMQHFLPAGPFAILPLVGDRSCITWSEEETSAKRILALSNEEFLAEVDLRFGGRLGEIRLGGPRQSFPLATSIARSYIGKRFALLGDSAHRVHPIAGQGLNLAFRDVAALAECLIDAARVGVDTGSAPILERYERWRRFDSVLSAATFDGLNTLFSKEHPLLRAAREVGLGLVDRLPQVKELLVSEAAGLTGETPKLLLGELP
ncbi:MAG: FAD-dependent monooxygenase [Hyphomicrobiaceae bacterium]